MKTNNQKDQLDALEDRDVEVGDNTYMVKQAEALEALMSNPHFKTLILDGYFKDFAVNQVSMLATERVRMDGNRAVIIEHLMGVSRLQDHFATIKALGGIAADDLEAEMFPDETEYPECI